MISDKIIGVFGGTGFLGHSIVQQLAGEGYRIKIITRHPESAYDLKLFGAVGQITPYFCDYSEESIDKAVSGCDFVINLVGILFERGKKGFARAHIDLPTQIAKACGEKDVQKFIHVSALACDKGSEKDKSKYAQSKFRGEEAIKNTYSDVTILRPSVVFGPGDSFFNMFAKLSTFLPALPLIGGGKMKFQPVYVEDIAQAVSNIMNDTSGQFAGEVFELGGPDIVTFEEIYKILLQETNRNRALVSIPWGIAKIQGAFMGMLPQPPLTLDQVKSLKTDNVVSGEAKTLADLGVTATAMEVVLPTYLRAYRRGGKFAQKNDERNDAQKAA